MSIAEYQALGRIEGAAHAEVAARLMVDWERERLEMAQLARTKVTIDRMAELMAAGATIDEVEAFSLAADQRFYDRLAEIAIEIRLAGLKPPPSPQERKTKRAARRAKAKGLQ
jgi:hypothetical protein